MVFAAYQRAGEWRVLPDRGFALGALLFGPLWLLARGAVAVGFAVAAVELLLAGLEARDLLGAAGPVLRFAAIAFVGLFAHDLCRLELRLGGFVRSTPVIAADRSTARLRLAERGA